jgi:hypothetical protein
MKQLKILIFFARSAAAMIKYRYQSSSKINVEKEMHVAISKMLLSFEVMS